MQTVALQFNASGYLMKDNVQLAVSEEGNPAILKVQEMPVIEEPISKLGLDITLLIAVPNHHSQELEEYEASCVLNYEQALFLKNFIDTFLQVNK
ncbi:hypothetical protein BWI93_15470 [Siphonobacter sp. BAB-5385]|uniref:hypothetical protein n=1 Tax=unclassified Siphonobacter TaxID=2635712 RepID=UPI000B9DEB48|nr:MULTISPECIES: hypothetical protein [unclassified Siphonobacter]OZI07408.1 hypothetical protein BWI93_15470 [Siphonobacter sp. BAB-5385]PMD88760.1 hypothetical protein BWI97_25100 [Siphonobacter sp. BAB-5405]